MPLPYRKSLQLVPLLRPLARTQCDGFETKVTAVRKLQWQAFWHVATVTWPSCRLLGINSETMSETSSFLVQENFVTELESSPA